MSIGRVFSRAFGTISAAIQTSLYVELRNWKDGPPSEALGDIFA